MKWWFRRNKRWLISCVAIILVVFTVIGMRRRINPLRVEKIVVYGQELTAAEMKQFIRLYNTSRISTKHPGCEPCTVDDRIYIYYSDGSYWSVIDHGSKDWEFEANYYNSDGKITGRKRVYIANERLDAFVQAPIEKYGLFE